MGRAAFVLGLGGAILAMLWSAAGAIPDPHAPRVYTWTVDGETVTATDAAAALEVSR